MPSSSWLRNVEEPISDTYRKWKAERNFEFEKVNYCMISVHSNPLIENVLETEIDPAPKLGNNELIWCRWFVCSKALNRVFHFCNFYFETQSKSCLEKQRVQAGSMYPQFQMNVKLALVIIHAEIMDESKNSRYYETTSDF